MSWHCPHCGGIFYADRMPPNCPLPYCRRPMPDPIAPSNQQIAGRVVGVAGHLAFWAFLALAAGFAFVVAVTAARL